MSSGEGPRLPPSLLERQAPGREPLEERPSACCEGLASRLQADAVHEEDAQLEAVSSGAVAGHRRSKMLCAEICTSHKAESVNQAGREASAKAPYAAIVA
jgi:hypothetical protein